MPAPEEVVVRTVEGKQVKIVYPYSGSMTSAGIAILAIGRDNSEEELEYLQQANW